MISVLLPTIGRPTLMEAAMSIRSTYPVELVVITDQQQLPIPLGGFAKITVVKRPRLGVIDAINEGYRHCGGNYVFVTNDQTVLKRGCLDYLLDATHLDNRNVIVGPKHVPDCNFSYYGREFIAFPFVSRDLLRWLHGRDDIVFNENYKAFYADPDLSLTALANGVELHTIEAAVIEHHNVHDAAHEGAVAAYLEHDRAVFRGRWDHLGEFKDP